jgi:hypothetical protein
MMDEALPANLNCGNGRRNPWRLSHHALRQPGAKKPPSPGAPFLRTDGHPAGSLGRAPDAPEDLSGSEEKLFKYLSGWLGGPPLYEQAHGHPRLRAATCPSPSPAAERDQWLMCMQLAFDECIPESPLRAACGPPSKASPTTCATAPTRPETAHGRPSR